MRRIQLRGFGLLLAQVLLSLSPATAQEYYFRQYEVTDGLSHNTIHCATQDDRGFLWFGTKNGLNRFDGYAFRWFQSDEDVPQSIGSNFIECIDFADGRLWVGTDSGLFAGDPKTFRFELVGGTAKQPILDIVHDAGGKLWFIANDTLRQLDHATGKIRTYPEQALRYARKIALSPANRLCLATAGGVFLHQPATDSFLPVALNVHPNGFPLVISSIYYLNESTLAVGTVSHGAFIYDIPNGTSVGILAQRDNRLYVRDFLLRGNDLWIGTEDGVYVYNIYGKTTIHLQKSNSRPFALSDNAIYCLFQDSKDGVWIGTYFRGLNYYSESLTSFRKYFPVSGQNSVNGSAVREFQQDKSGRLWIGTEDAGLDRYDPQTGEFEHLPLRTADEQIVATNVHGLLIRDDEIWVGTFQNGLFILDILTGQVKKHYVAGAASGFKSNFIFSLKQKRDGTILALTASGIHRYRPELEKFVEDTAFSPAYFYTSFLEDRDGGLWAGTYWDGLFYHHPTKGINRVYTKSADDELRISNNAINGIYQCSDGNVWVATENGLNVVSPQTGAIRRYGKKDGFPSNVFYSILEDGQGQYWLSTANGLVRFNPATGQLSKYTTENGLLSNQFNYNSAFRNEDGRMYFGCVEGFIAFDPYDARFAKQVSSDKLVLTDFNVVAGGEQPGDRPFPTRLTAGQQESVKLAYDQSTFNVSYSALDFRTPGLTEYSYKLKGLDDEWINTGSNNKVFFTSLHPGNYVLSVKSRVHNSAWSTPEDLLRIEITPPVWRSNFAYLLYFIAGALLFYSALRFYHQYNKARNRQRMELFDNEKEKEIYRAKIEFFTNVSHEILTPLTLIKSPVENLLKQAKEGSNLEENLSVVHKNTVRLVNLVQQLLDFRKTEMEHTTLSFVPVPLNRVLLETIARHASEIADKGIVLTHNLEKSAIEAYVDLEAFRKITGNLSQNAIKYGKEHLSIHLSATEAQVTIRFRNDGLVIPPAEKDRIFQPFYRLPEHASQPGTGIGLSLAYSLTELHEGSLRLDLSDPEANTFVLTLPRFQKDNFELTPSSKWVRVEDKGERSPAAGTQDHRSTILLVEDNLDLLDFVAKDLMANYPVLKATTAEEALHLLESQNVQLIISDVMMPGMDGFELCRAIKTNLELSHIPIILLTSRSNLTSEISGLEAGADAYISKPFSMDYLKTRVNNLLTNRKHVLDHFSSTPLAHIQSIAHSPIDEEFIQKLNTIIEENITNPDLNVADLAERMHMSRSTLYRKIKDLSGCSPNELINITRLKKAAGLLRSKQYKIYEIAEMVGYNSATSFGRSFQKQFQMSPSDYASTDESV